MLCLLIFAFSSLILSVSAIAAKSSGSILRMSVVVINPISFFFSTTGSLRTFFVLNFFKAFLMSAPGFIVVTFFVMISLTWV